MDNRELEFIRDLKVLLTKFEYERDKDGKMDLVDSMYYLTRDFSSEYCD
jgi:hypothetical protein